MRDDRFWRVYGIPAAAALSILTGLNALWNHTALGAHVKGYVPYPVAIYLLGGSGVALLVLWRAIRAGRLAPRELGIDLSGWTAPKRLAGLALILALSYGQFALSFVLFPKAAGEATAPPAGLDLPAAGARAAEEQPAAPQPTWGQYCFWFVILLPASQTEVLVFIGAGFCLVERGLRQRGLGSLMASASAAVFASAAFGLYHYSHAPHWHPLVFPLMGEMLLVLLFFVPTRNLYLTLGVHNAIAAMGFLREQYSSHPLDPAMLPRAGAVIVILPCFVVPFLLLHGLEWWGRPGPAAADKAAGPAHH
jgi:hypothetical protein